MEMMVVSQSSVTVIYYDQILPCARRVPDYCMFISCLQSDYNTAFPRPRKSRVSSHRSIVVIIVTTQTLWLSFLSSFKWEESIRANCQRIKLLSDLRWNHIYSNRANNVHVCHGEFKSAVLALYRHMSADTPIMWRRDGDIICVTVEPEQ